ncbi:hypothetical protein DNTS_026135 [Danionella cerebrum]|uniref:Uncharacterized protein n=1 Tax=Danionella cerebrum TaxID=2873325 RepID=A0A553NAP2_9TELE|nr:hypothetical protein DNTS_026135 [Danionella translucida]
MKKDEPPLDFPETLDGFEYSFNEAQWASWDIDSRQQALIVLSFFQSLESVAAPRTSCACYGLSVAYSALSLVACDSIPERALLQHQLSEDGQPDSPEGRSGTKKDMKHWESLTESYCRLVC